MLRTLRLLSTAALLMSCIASALIGLGTFAAYQSVPVQLAYVLVSMSSSGLGFAVGVMGLIITSRQHSWFWFTAILVPLLALNYGPRAFFVDAPLRGIADSGPQAYAIAQFIIGGLLPAIVPFITLLYSRPPRPAAPDLGDLGLEYTKL